MLSNIWATCSFLPKEESLYGVIFSDIFFIYANIIQSVLTVIAFFNL
jgi:hypothetical protein